MLLLVNNKTFCQRKTRNKIILHRFAPMKLVKTDNEVIIFLVNFFLLEAVGQLMFRGFMLLLRFFGMPQPYFWFHSDPLYSKILFTLLLAAAMGISIRRILKR